MCVYVAGVVGFEPTKCRSQSPVPYRLATPHWGLKLAGVAGFEPAGAKVKVSCLTAWRHPYGNGVSKETRTLDLQSHNLAL